MGVEIGGIIEESHEDEEGRRIIDKVKIEYLSLIPDNGVIDALEFSGSAEGAKNTDVEIWRKIPDDYYSPSIHVTEQDGIGINVGGHVLVAPVERWFAAGEAAFCVEDECHDCRYGSCDTCPPSHMDFEAWDQLSDEALENFEKLVEESVTGQGYGGCFHPWESRAKLFPDYVGHPLAWELTFWDKIRYRTFSDWVDWLMGR